MDISEEFDKLDSDTRDKWLDYCKEMEEHYNKLNFIPYYSSKTPSRDTMTLLYDGMSGEYSKLIIVKEYVYKSDSEELDDEIVSSINDELAKVIMKIKHKQNL